MLQAKFTDMSTVMVSSPVVDVSYFLYSSVDPDLITSNYVTLLQVIIYKQGKHCFQRLNWCARFKVQASW